MPSQSLPSQSFQEVVQRFAVDLVFVVDRGGTIRDANDRFWSELGLTKDTAGPAALLSVIVDDERALALRTWNTVLSSRSSQRSVRKIKSVRGETKVFSIVESPVTVESENGLVLGVARDITEESALEEKLWSAHESRVSALEYSVRASIGLVKGYLFSLQKIENLPKEKQEQFSRVIAEEIDTMGRNIENLILSRGNGEVNGESIVFDIGDIVDQALVFCKGECERRKITVHVEKPQGSLNFYGQAFAVLRIIGNILDFEMMRLTHSSDVQITLSDSEEYIEIKVCDNGPAVEQEQLEWLSGHSQASKDQYIALSSGKADFDVARLIAESLGGGVIAETDADGGLMCTIMLPRIPITFDRAESNSAEFSVKE